ncbi:hypothetical protein DSO57_1034679 [Entomophthora muscae]|uniref:Uncharacterized protein n=1 Tax=Entomophthora muscae TaxID=34485 RepID=A0ACC2UK64_9FUNG|nr:hypothetical protein DSO57_1034679 [Entomophthora muscae]
MRQDDSIQLLSPTTNKHTNTQTHKHLSQAKLPTPSTLVLTSSLGKKNIINWLDHSATKLCASRISHKKWVQEASKRLYRAAANWFTTWFGSQTDDQLDNWEEFKADIPYNFHVTKSLQDIVIQLSNLPQKTTIMAYANEFEEIRRKIQNPAQADNVHQSLIHQPNVSGIHSLGSLSPIEWRRAPKLNLIRVEPTVIPIISMCRR